jgi:hypothetical protein
LWRPAACAEWCEGATTKRIAFALLRAAKVDRHVASLEPNDYVVNNVLARW